MDSKKPRLGQEPGLEMSMAADIDGSTKTTPSTQPVRLDPVDAFFAAEPLATRAIRRSISWCNASAAVRAARSPDDDARGLFWLTAQLAGCWTFRPASQESLKDARQALRYLFLAAGMIERLETFDGD